MTDAQLPLDRLPPNNPEAEEAVLGSLLMDPEATDKVRAELGKEDFYRERNGAIYEAVLAVRTRRDPVDFVSVSDELKRQGRFDEVGGITYLSHLIGVVPTAVHIEHYAGIVKRTAIKRRLISAAGKMAAVAYDDTIDAEQSLSMANELLAGVQGRLAVKDTYTPDEQAAMLMAMVDAMGRGTPPGIPSHFIRKDGRPFMLYRKGCLYAVGAVTKMGKTSWMISEARKMCEGGLRVLFASGEMPVDEIVKRNASSIAGRDWNELEREGLRPQEYPDTQTKLTMAMGRMGDVAPHVYDGARMTVERIRNRVSRMQAEGGCDAVFVDYLQRLHGASSKEDRYRQVDAIAEDLKSMARELKVPVIVAAQFNSNRVMSRPLAERAPLFTDFRESGGIAQEADVALGLHRWSRYTDFEVTEEGEVLDGKEGRRRVEGDPSDAWLYVLVNRHGAEDGRVALRWIASTCTYEAACDADGRPV
jgi:replicative DNA helicase